MNVARLRAPLDSPQLADFVGALDRINAIADGSPGFVWRLQDDSGNATALRPMGEDIIVNMSVWRDPQSLQAFVYRSDHVGVMRRRREWFEKMDLVDSSGRCNTMWVGTTGGVAWSGLDWARLSAPSCGGAGVRARR